MTWFMVQQRNRTTRRYIYIYIYKVLLKGFAHMLLWELAKQSLYMMMWFEVHRESSWHRRASYNPHGWAHFRSNCLQPGCNECPSGDARILHHTAKHVPGPGVRESKEDREQNEAVQRRQFWEAQFILTKLTYCRDTTVHPLLNRHPYNFFKS